MVRVDALKCDELFGQDTSKSVSRLPLNAGVLPERFSRPVLFRR